MKIGHDLSILVSVATAHCALASETIFATVVDVSEKAVKVSATTYNDKEITAWFPKKSLTCAETRNVASGEYVSVKLAKWFNASGWTATFMSLTTKSNVLTA